MATRDTNLLLQDVNDFTKMTGEEISLRHVRNSVHDLVLVSKFDVDTAKNDETRRGNHNKRTDLL